MFSTFEELCNSENITLQHLKTKTKSTATFICTLLKSTDVNRNQIFNALWTRTSRRRIVMNAKTTWPETRTYDQDSRISRSARKSYPDTRTIPAWIWSLLCPALRLHRNHLTLNEKMWRIPTEMGKRSENVEARRAPRERTPLISNNCVPIYTDITCAFLST